MRASPAPWAATGTGHPAGRPPATAAPPPVPPTPAPTAAAQRARPRGATAALRPTPRRRPRRSAEPGSRSSPANRQPPPGRPVLSGCSPAHLPPPFWPGGRGEGTGDTHTYTHTPARSPSRPPRSCDTCCPAPASPGRRPPTPRPRTRSGSGAARRAYSSAPPTPTPAPRDVVPAPAQHLPKVYPVSPPTVAAQRCQPPSRPLRGSEAVTQRPRPRSRRGAERLCAARPAHLRYARPRVPAARG